MDLQMPDMNGIEAMIGIRSEFPNARIIVLTTYAGDVQVIRALKAGARGYILKGRVHKELLETIRSVHAGHKRVPPEVAAALAEHVGDDELSARELDVLRLIAAAESRCAHRGGHASGHGRDGEEQRIPERFVLSSECLSTSIAAITSPK
jgi:DNA-binding NarL/FixJ family response regulator